MEGYKIIDYKCPVLDDVEIKMGWRTFESTQKGNSEWLKKKIKPVVETIKAWCCACETNDWEGMSKAVEDMRKAGIEDMEIKYPMEEDKKRGKISMCIPKKGKEDWYIDIEFETTWDEDLSEVNKAWLGTVNKTESKRNFDVETYIDAKRVDKEVNEAIQRAMYEANFRGIEFLTDHMRKCE